MVSALEGKMFRERTEDVAGVEDCCPAEIRSGFRVLVNIRDLNDRRHPAIDCRIPELVDDMVAEQRDAEEICQYPDLGERAVLVFDALRPQIPASGDEEQDALHDLCVDIGEVEDADVGFWPEAAELGLEIQRVVPEGVLVGDE